MNKKVIILNDSNDATGINGTIIDFVVKFDHTYAIVEHGSIIEEIPLDKLRVVQTV